MNEAYVLSCMSSYEPSAVTDNDGNIFFNPPMKALMDLPEEMRLPFEVFQQQEKLSRENRIFVRAFNQLPFGRNACQSALNFDQQTASNIDQGSALFFP